MKTAKKLILAAVVLPLTLATTSAFAYGGKHHKGGSRHECGMNMDRSIMNQLDLTDEQRTKLKEMRDERRADMKQKFKGGAEGKHAEMQAHRAKMQELMLADNFDEAAATALAKQMVEKHTEYKVQMMARQHKMLSVLTPEQKAKFTELQNERMNECADKMQKRMKADKQADK